MDQLEFLVGPVLLMLSVAAYAVCDHVRSANVLAQRVRTKPAPHRD